MVFILVLHAVVIAAMLSVTVALSRWAQVPVYWGVILNLPGVAYVVYTCVQVMIGVSADPTSNNLWPIALAIVALKWVKFAAVLWAGLALLGAWRRWRSA